MELGGLATLCHGVQKLSSEAADRLQEHDRNPLVFWSSLVWSWELQEEHLKHLCLYSLRGHNDLTKVDGRRRSLRASHAHTHTCIDRDVDIYRDMHISICMYIRMHEVQPLSLALSTVDVHNCKP